MRGSNSQLLSADLRLKQILYGSHTNIKTSFSIIKHIIYAVCFKSKSCRRVNKRAQKKEFVVRVHFLVLCVLNFFS
jgi:hypothetical protein